MYLAGERAAVKVFETAPHGHLPQGEVCTTNEESSNEEMRGAPPSLVCRLTAALLASAGFH